MRLSFTGYSRAIKGLARPMSRPIGQINFLSRYSSDGKANSRTDEPVVGPGGPSDRIPSMYEQSAGLERLEYLANLAQRPLFLDQPLRPTAFGTLASPVPVPSISGERIVGCSGFPTDSHELMWFEVRQTKGTSRCPECGQAFAIELVNQEIA